MSDSVSTEAVLVEGGTDGAKASALDVVSDLAVKLAGREMFVLKVDHGKPEFFTSFTGLWHRVNHINNKDSETFPDVVWVGATGADNIKNAEEVAKILIGAGKNSRARVVATKDSEKPDDKTSVGGGSARNSRVPAKKIVSKLQIWGVFGN